jgi:hypothetical protein
VEEPRGLRGPVAFWMIAATQCLLQRACFIVADR